MAVSIREVAGRAGVSVGTVSNVLNRPERVAASTAERVQAAIRDLGFVRNEAARQLREGRSRSIGLIVLDIGNPFFADVARGAERRAIEAGMTVVLGNSDELAERENAYVDLFSQQRVSGVLLTPATDELGAVEVLRASGVRAVIVDRDVGDVAVSSVAVDNVHGGSLAVRHLLELGHRRIAFVGELDRARQVMDRLAGARAAVAEYADATLEVLDTTGMTVAQGRAAAERIVQRPADSRPDAIFAANDLLAVGILQVFSFSRAIRVPDDIALIGYDDIDFAAAAVVPLTSIRQPADEIGYRAVDLLLSESDDVSAVRFSPELVARASTLGEAAASA